MAMVKMTKTELRSQQIKLQRLQQYLPTLQLKKALLQLEVQQCQSELEQLSKELAEVDARATKFASLLSEREAPRLLPAFEIDRVEKRIDNIAGIDVPVLVRVVFVASVYSLFDTSYWFESAAVIIKKLIVLREKIKIINEKKALLEKELRDVSIRVNLFEKIMIPRTLQNIQKIKIFLSDLQLAAVAQAKVAKKKILLRQNKVNDYSA